MHIYIYIYIYTHIYIYIYIYIYMLRETWVQSRSRHIKDFKNGT